MELPGAIQGARPPANDARPHGGGPLVFWNLDRRASRARPISDASGSVIGPDLTPEVLSVPAAVQRRNVMHIATVWKTLYLSLVPQGWGRGKWEVRSEK